MAKGLVAALARHGTLASAGMRTITIAALLGLSAVATHPAAATTSEPSEILREGWNAYVARFVEADGRVVDPRGGGISTSEGQAYAMLRAVWMRDRAVFDKTYAWALAHLNTGVRKDRLWGWKWSKSADGQWRVPDSAFASDADQDVALALILAFHTWRDERYRRDATAILADLWRLGTIKVEGRRFLLAGDKLCKGRSCRINASYYAPYAYRIFAIHDPQRDWRGLVDSSYFVLESAASLTSTRLPPDWMLLDKSTGRLALSDRKDSVFSYDAFRAYWRVALDLELFGEPRAQRYLNATLPWLINRWERTGTFPAVVSSAGEDLARYEATEMLTALGPAIRPLRPDIAAAVDRKLRANFKNGLWADNAGQQDSYYLQNWAWFGTALYDRYLQPLASAARATGN